MPGFENKLWGMKYDEHYTKTCYKEVCTFLGCTDVPYPCGGMKTKKYEIFIGFNYPSVSPQQQSIIYECADIATSVAYKIIMAAVATCGALTPVACIGIVAGAIFTANEAAKTAFRECLIKSGLPTEIIKKSKIGIYDRKS